jgi:hypothetical protein
VSVVVVETVQAEIRDVEVLETVVVEVARADALSPAFVGDARGQGHVCEGPIAIVVEERRRGGWFVAA